MSEPPEREWQLGSRLPRDSAPDPGQEDRLVATLKSEGFFQRRVPGSRWPLRLAAAVALLLLGGLAGHRLGRQGGLEAELARPDLDLAERVLLLQRAGSAYVRAAQAYADATSAVDTTAVEVASRVLLGAASAVARRHLDGGVRYRLAEALEAGPAPPVTPAPTLIWY